MGASMRQQVVRYIPCSRPTLPTKVQQQQLTCPPLSVRLISTQPRPLPPTAPHLVLGPARRSDVHPLPVPARYPLRTTIATVLLVSFPWTVNLPAPSIA